MLRGPASAFAAATILCSGAASGAALAQSETPPSTGSFGNRLFHPAADPESSGISWTEGVKVLDGATKHEVRRHQLGTDPASAGAPTGMNHSCEMHDAAAM